MKKGMKRGGKKKKKCAGSESGRKMRLRKKMEAGDETEEKDNKPRQGMTKGAECVTITLEPSSLRDSETNWGWYREPTAGLTSF